MQIALLVFNDPKTREALSRTLRELPCEVVTADSWTEACQRLHNAPVDLVFTDLTLMNPEIREAIGRGCRTPILVRNQGENTYSGEILAEFAAQIAPPFSLRSLQMVIAPVLREAVQLRKQESAPTLSGESPIMLDLIRGVERMGPTSASVLITGETGSGKEVVARNLHAHSLRRSGPFVAINCGAISPSLMESQLFGHERGSFTGATSRHRGVFERAHLGTLFLDEVTEMPLDLQVKLLRVLEEGEFHRTGGEELVRVNVRTIAATNRDPKTAISEGRLRADLFYRLNVLHLPVPPLRARLEDIPLLAKAFFAEFAGKEGRARSIATETLELFSSYHWPGNVRELRNAVLAGLLMATGAEVTPSALPPEIQASLKEGFPTSDSVFEVPFGTSIEEVERHLVLSTLAQAKGNRTHAARTLGISTKTLYNRLSVYGTDGKISRN